MEGAIGSMQRDSEAARLVAPQMEMELKVCTLYFVLQARVRPHIDA